MESAEGRQTVKDSDNLNEVIDNSLIPKLKLLGIPINNVVWNTIKSQIARGSFFKTKLLENIESEINAFTRELNLSISEEHSIIYF